MAVQPAQPIQPFSPEPFELEVEYSERDGRPVGETEVHIQCLIDAREALRNYFRDDPNVYVGANLLLYYERGQPFLVVSTGARP